MHQMYLSKVILVLTLLIVSTWALPTPPEEKHGNGPPPVHPSIIVTSPGPGPWAIGSQQSVTWRTENYNVEAPYSPDTTVHYGLFAHTDKKDVLIKVAGPYKFGGGYAPLDIDCSSFAPGIPFYVQVQLDKPGKDGSLVFGNSGFFTVYKTEDKSVCPNGPGHEPVHEYGDGKTNDEPPYEGSFPTDGTYGPDGEEPPTEPKDDKPPTKSEDDKNLPTNVPKGEEPGDDAHTGPTPDDGKAPGS